MVAVANGSVGVEFCLFQAWDFITGRTVKFGAVTLPGHTSVDAHYFNAFNSIPDSFRIRRIAFASGEAVVG